MADDEIRFRSKVDAWLGSLLIAATVGGPLATFLLPPKRGAVPLTLPLTFLLLAIPMVVVVWLFVTTAYTISGPNLIVRGGPIRVVVPIDSITRIARSSSLASAPTLSLSRLSIEYGRSKEILVSPKDRQEFIHAIVARVPNVVLEDLDEYR